MLDITQYVSYNNLMENKIDLKRKCSSCWNYNAFYIKQDTCFKRWQYLIRQKRVLKVAKHQSPLPYGNGLYS